MELEFIKDNLIENLSTGIKGENFQKKNKAHQELGCGLLWETLFWDILSQA